MAKKKMTKKEKALANKARQIAKSNKKFANATKAEKRVLIAQDVIAQIEAKIMIGASGNYVKNINLIEGSVWDMDDDGVKENYEKIASCNVCAMGACVMSVTKFNNKLLFSDTREIEDNKKAQGLMAELFSKKQLYLIESAFEGVDDDCIRLAINMGYNPKQITDKEKEACNVFYTHFGGLPNHVSGGDVVETKRLLAIMKNIVKHKGTFKPQDLDV